MTRSAVVAAQDRDRSRIDPGHTWDLSDIYPDRQAWAAQRAAMAEQIPRLGAFQGRLGESAGVLADALESMSHLDKELSRLYVYASMLSDEDTRQAEPQGMQQEMQQIFARFMAQASFIEPELLKLPSEVVERFLAGEPRLQPYAFYLRDVVRRAPHTLSDAEEKILADAAPLAASAANIFNILSNADFPYPTITLSDGRALRVNQAGYAEVRTSPVRDDRRSAWRRSSTRSAASAGPSARR
jgi:oligoendopeptidase F